MYSLKYITGSKADSERGNERGESSIMVQSRRQSIIKRNHIKLFKQSSTNWLLPADQRTHSRICLTTAKNYNWENAETYFNFWMFLNAVGAVLHYWFEEDGRQWYSTFDTKTWTQWTTKVQSHWDKFMMTQQVYNKVKIHMDTHAKGVI